MIPVEKLRWIPTEQLRLLNTAVVQEIRRRARESSHIAIRRFTKGDLVRFHHRTKDEWIHGVVVEVGRTKVRVRQSISEASYTQWNVPAHMLSFTGAD